MRSIASIVSVLFVLVAGWLPAQDTPQRPAALDRFERLVGNWTGKGTVVMQPGTEPSTWTSVSTCRRVLDGWAYLDDTVISFEGMPETLAFRGLWTYDLFKQQYVQISFGNVGPGGMQNVHWIDENTITGAHVMAQGGSIMAERWITKFTEEGTQEFRIDQSTDGGPYLVHVAGTLARGGKGCDLEKVGDVGSFMTELPAEMGRYPHPNGVFELKSAKMVPYPGMEAMTIKGRETLKTLLGGHLAQGHVQGEPMAPETPGFEAYSFIGWDPAENCYRSYWVSNMGDVADERGYLQEDGSVIYTNTTVMGTMPVAKRWILTPKGKGYTVRGWRLAGAFDADLEFDAEFVPVAH